MHTSMVVLSLAACPSPLQVEAEAEPFIKCRLLGAKCFITFRDWIVDGRFVITPRVDFEVRSLPHAFDRSIHLGPWMVHSIRRCQHWQQWGLHCRDSAPLPKQRVVVATYGHCRPTVARAGPVAHRRWLSNSAIFAPRVMKPTAVSWEGLATAQSDFWGDQGCGAPICEASYH